MRQAGRSVLGGRAEAVHKDSRLGDEPSFRMPFILDCMENLIDSHHCMVALNLCSMHREHLGMHKSL